jgi:hypothetical protein
LSLSYALFSAFLLYFYFLFLRKAKNDFITTANEWGEKKKTFPFSTWMNHWWIIEQQWEWMNSRPIWWLNFARGKINFPKDERKTRENECPQVSWHFHVLSVISKQINKQVSSKCINSVWVNTFFLVYEVRKISVCEKFQVHVQVKAPLMHDDVKCHAL